MDKAFMKQLTVDGSVDSSLLLHTENGNLLHVLHTLLLGADPNCTNDQGHTPLSIVRFFFLFFSPVFYAYLGF